MKNNKVKATSVNTFIIPLIIITAAFFLFDVFIIGVVKEHYYDIKKEEAGKLAKSYSVSLINAAQAQEVVNDLLGEKLIVAGRTTANYEANHSNGLLGELAKELEVDIIYSYDDKAEVIYSSNGDFIGWKAYEGHPVYDFMKSGEVSRVGNIRQDTETGVFYKYGYFRKDEGGFVQIGVLAEKISQFLGRFEVEKLLLDMSEDKDIKDIKLVDDEFRIISSTNDSLIGEHITNLEVRNAAKAGIDYGYVNNSKEEKVYEIFISSELAGSKISLLGVEYSLKDTDILIKRISIIGSVVLLVIYASVLYAMLITRKTDKKLLEAAYYDPLTGLPNQQHMQTFLEKTVKSNSGKKQALLLVNCNNFRLINMTFGYEFGDETIKRLAKELKRVAGKTDKVYRLSAARFAIYKSEYDGKRDLVSLIGKINEVFEKPVSTVGTAHYLKIRTGVVEINSGESIGNMLKNALIALSEAGKKDEGNYTFFSNEMKESNTRAERIENELKDALSNEGDNRLYMVYQPFYNLKTGETLGFEALARMKSKIYGEVSPIEFIDIAERSRLMVPLGNHLFETACDFSRKVKEKHKAGISVAINISGIQLLQDVFVSVISDIMGKTGIEEKDIILEITESILLENFDDINNRLAELKNKNIRIALDDFGKGYSSFYRLQELNVDILKIDKVFIDRIKDKENGEFITAEIIAIAHKLGLAVVAEGVQTSIQKQYLEKNNCDIIQGYLLSMPLSEESALNLLDAKP